MIRNLTEKYSELRSVYTASPFFNQDDDNELEMDDVELGFNPRTQPAWSKIMSTVKFDISSIQKRSTYNTMQLLILMIV